MKKILMTSLSVCAIFMAANAWAENELAKSDYPAVAGPVEGGILSGRIVSIDKMENEIVVRDEAGMERRVKVEPSILSSTKLGVGDPIRIQLTPGTSPRAQAINLGS